MAFMTSKIIVFAKYKNISEFYTSLFVNCSPGRNSERAYSILFVSEEVATEHILLYGFDSVFLIEFLD